MYRGREGCYREVGVVGIEIRFWVGGGLKIYSVRHKGREWGTMTDCWARGLIDCTSSAKWSFGGGGYERNEVDVFLEINSRMEEGGFQKILHELYCS